MSKRIFRNVVLTAIFAVLLTAMLIVPALYNVHEQSMNRELRQEADCIACALELADDDVSYLKDLNTDSRITLISSGGSVLYDSIADAGEMENHAERPEVILALRDGSGESTRLSDTLSETTLYYARRTDDGSVLRIANTRSSMLGTFMNVLPLVAVMLLCVVAISLLIARRAAKRIVAPILSLNLEHPLENDAYDELAPLLTRMHQQNARLREHVQALESAHAKLAAIMENMREGMILLDKANTVLSMNESAACIFEVSPTKYIGQSLLSVNRDVDLQHLVQSALRGEEGSLMMTRGDRHYQICASPVMKDEAVRGVVLLILDMTEHFAAEISRREFTANVSHELKTPLTSISGFAEIIRDGIAQPQDVAHFAGMICKESARLIALVNDILELSRLDEQQKPGPEESVALKPLLQTLVEGFSIAAEKKNLSLRLNCADVQVEGYSLLLREMFSNLVDNAVKYTPEGGLVAVEVMEKDGKICCCVSDNGIGIPAEHQAHVFERFYRVDKSHSRATGGTGLGLAIVKHIAQIHHAELTMESREGAGTAITICFKESV